jgi:lipopolysaccharide transport system ATP-binding protein
MGIVLKTENLGKKYLIKHQNAERYNALRDVISQKAKTLISNPFKRKATPVSTTEEFWALRDINFEVNAGEKIGIIGRNGAGKSTLLKLLSRITEPTYGRIGYNGKIASLLEVGTGFHPELTGKENIFLNGAILGMSKNDIFKKFDEIVAFAEVEKFLDTPVKRYSSGMYVRLAFAVAAHIETDILIVDEVLAVGDVKFQKKSLEKMNNISKSGRTLLFVSHNMGAISELCSKGLVLNSGGVIYQGEVQECINEYNKTNENPIEGADRFRRTKYTEVELLDVKAENEAGVIKNVFDINEKINIIIDYEIKEKLVGLQLTLTIFRNFTPVIHSFNTDELENCIEENIPGKYRAALSVSKMFLKAGAYSISVTVGTPDKLIFNIEDAIFFEVDELTLNTIHRGYRNNRIGHVIMQGKWENDKIQ